MAARDGGLARAFLGRPLDAETVEQMCLPGIDACGENGEFHTAVTAGTLFRGRLNLRCGACVLRSGCWFVDLSVDGERAQATASTANAAAR